MIVTSVVFIFLYSGIPGAGAAAMADGGTVIAENGTVVAEEVDVLNEGCHGPLVTRPAGGRTPSQLTPS